MRPVTLIAVDLDGTLLDTQKNVSAETRDVINKLKEYGILFGIVTGRPVESTLILCRKWGIEQSISFICGVNGGTIYDCRTKEKENFAHLDGKRILQILEYYKDMPQLHPEVMIGNKRYVPWSNEHTLAVGKLFAEEEIIVDLEDFLNHHDADKLILRSTPEDQAQVKKIAEQIHFDDVTSFSTSDVLYEFMDPKINKGYGLDRLVEHYGLNHENVAVFGDESNDMEMIQKAGIGIAMNNAIPAVKEIADIVIPWTNDESGIARFIEETVLPYAQGKLNRKPEAKK